VCLFNTNKPTHDLWNTLNNHSKTNKTKQTKGCRLPIEMWFPVAEWPPPAVVTAFEKLGVAARQLDFRGLNITTFKDAAAKAKSFEAPSMARFTIKVAALLLSRFQEVCALFFYAFVWIVRCFAGGRHTMLCAASSLTTPPNLTRLTHPSQTLPPPKKLKTTTISSPQI
jgi:hypothetical protein